MDPVSIIVSALLVGIASVSEASIKDAYQGLKTLIQNRYKISVENLEQKPNSEAQKAAIAERLAENKAGDDLELIEKANAVVEAVEKTDLTVARAVGVSLEDVKAAIVTFRSVRARAGGTGVEIKRGDFQELNFGDVEDGQSRLPGKTKTPPPE